MNAKAYFLRLDIVRTVSRALFVLSLLIAYAARSVSLGTTGIVFLILSLIVFGICSMLKVPQESKLTEWISKERNLFEASVLKENKSFRDRTPAPIHAYGIDKKRFARTVRGRLVYPICLNMMFLKHETGGTLITGELSLWEKKPTETKTYKFSNMKIHALRLEGDAEMLLVTFLEADAEHLTFYVKDDHYWKGFVAYVKESVPLVIE